jgi:hypothetical protein
VDGTNGGCNSASYGGPERRRDCGCSAIDLALIGVGDRPADPLQELRRRVRALQYRQGDALLIQRSADRFRGRVRDNDYSSHDQTFGHSSPRQVNVL